MFGIFSAIGGIFSIIKGWMNWKTVKQIDADIDKAIPVIEQTLPVIQETVKTVGEVATAASGVTSSVADVVKADAETIVADSNNVKPIPGSWFANNVRPAISLMFAVLIVLDALGYVHMTLNPQAVDLMLGLLGIHFAGRSLEKIVNLVSQKVSK